LGGQRNAAHGGHGAVVFAEVFKAYHIVE
jgi:hypothetical protein